MLICFIYNEVGSGGRSCVLDDSGPFGVQGLQRVPGEIPQGTRAAQERQQRGSLDPPVFLSRRQKIVFSFV